MLTFDSRTIDATGVFLIGELEKLDPTLHQPLVTYTWLRDVDLREDVTIADEYSSYTLSNWSHTGNIVPNGKNWVGKATNAIAGPGVDIGKKINPLTPWASELTYTIFELESSIKVGRPIDLQKLDVIKTKYQMDADEQVYIGDTTLGVTGLTNNASVSTTNAPNGASSSPLWSNKTAAEILADVNTVLTNAWTASGWKYVPSKIGLPPADYSLLVNNIVSTAGNRSILNYLKENSIAMEQNGRPLDIVPMKWLTGRGTSGTNRLIAYTQERDLVRFPVVPLQRTALEYRSLSQIVTYYARLGVVEIVYPETVAYLDGI